MRTKRLGILATMAAGGLFAFAGPANGASVNDTVLTGLSAFPPGAVIQFDFIDDSRETLVNTDGTVVERVPGSPGSPATFVDAGGGVLSETTLDVGDKLRGIFKASDFRVDSGTEEPFDTSFEVTAIFETEVLTKTSLGGGAFSFTFGPSSSFATELAGLGNVSASAADLAGTLVAIFEDQSPDFSVSTGTLAGDEATAIDGSPWAFLGFTGAGLAPAPGEGWATGSVPTDDITALPPNLLGAFANIAVNRLAISDSLSSSLTIVPTVSGAFGATPVEFTATTTFQGGSGSTIWPVTDQTTVTFSAIPVPAAFVPGLAMVGGVFFARRRRELAA